MDIQEWKINEFLINCKNAIVSNDFTIINRKKYKEFLESFKLFIDEPKNIILELEPGDYISGPEEDKNNPLEKDIWIFKKQYNNSNCEIINLYIKLKLIYNNNKYYVKCISFHKDEK